MEEKYEFTKEMREISGFNGDYEKWCQLMLKAGLEWFDKNPNVNPKFRRYEGIFGLVTEDNYDAKQLSNIIIEGVEKSFDDSSLSGAMHHAVINHILYIRGNSWEKYVKEMSK